MRITRLLTVVLALLLTAVCALAGTREHWPALVGLCVAASAVLAIIVVQGRLTTSWVLGLAIVFRLLFAWLPPVLSDDAYRYVWDGMVQAEGLNPYRFTPSSDSLASHHHETVFERLNSKEYYTVYPPVSQIVFLLGGLVYDWGWMASYYIIKALLIAFEIGALLILSRLVSGPALALYAWHPLVLIETAGQAHTESVMLCFLALTLWFSAKRKGGLAGAMLACAGWTKLYPFVFFPFLFRQYGWKPVLYGGVVTLGLLIPYFHAAFFPNILSSLDLYVRYFEFNAGLYYGVKQLFYYASGDDWSKQLGPAFRVFFLVAMGVLYGLDAWKRWPLQRGFLLAVTVFLLFSTTVHPWYLLSALFLATMNVRTPWHWHWLTTLSIGTYLLYIAGPYWLFVNVAWWGWFVIGYFIYRKEIGSALQAAMRMRARGKARRVAPFLPRRDGEPLRVLDLGAAEGYVGEEIGRLVEADIVLADVVDMNKTRLPHVSYDGKHLPFEDASFDAVILYFVLHHCEDPEAVVQEALRVTRGRIIVVESVYESDQGLRRLTWFDKRANRLRAFGKMRAQEPFLRFRRVAEWKRCFVGLGARVVAEGGWGGALHRQHLFIVERSPFSGSQPLTTPRSAAS